MKRKLNKIVKRIIVHLFGYQDKNTQPYRRLMYQFFRNHDWGYHTAICSVKVEKVLNKTTLVIETHLPGILIGKAGWFIDSLEKHINEGMGKEIHIRIEESKLWRNLYK